MASWPSTLQECLNENNFTYTPGNVSITQDMEIGPKKSRRRYTTPVDMITGSIDLHKDDYNTLYNFYYSTLGGGVDYFDVDHPITKDPISVRFTEPFNVSTKGGEWFIVNLSWEVSL